MMMIKLTPAAIATLDVLTDLVAKSSVVVRQRRTSGRRRWRWRLLLLLLLLLGHKETPQIVPPQKCISAFTARAMEMIPVVLLVVLWLLEHELGW